MRVFVTFFVLLSITYGLHARCLDSRESGDDCPVRVFSEPEPRQIHYIYHGESCDCPKYHDIIVQKPEKEEKPIHNPKNYEYNVVKPETKAVSEKDGTRYLFDVRIEQPVTMPTNAPSESFNYQLHEASKPDVQKKNSIRYIFDTRIEKPIKPCDEKPWQGLVTQIDAVLAPQPSKCTNPNHSEGNCSCGCQNPSHTPQTCDCNRSWNLPIFASLDDKTIYKRIKRNTKNKPAKQRNFKDVKPFKRVQPNDLITKGLRRLKIITTPKSVKSASYMKSLRMKRREKSPCAYEYETCDHKGKTPAGCPLCYKCQCQPSNEPDNLKFSAKNIKIPYRIATHDQDFSPATQQEFDYEPSAYTGLNRPDMYRKYIEQVISKYPEHMSRKMPNVMDLQSDLAEFINDLAKYDKSPSGKVKNENIQYQIIDDAMELYKLYEKSIGSKINPLGNKKIFNKRGTVLEVIEVDPDDLKNGKFKLPDLQMNLS